MKKLFLCMACLFLFFCEKVLGADALFSMDSSFADYDGNRLFLRGNIVLEHSLGSICSDRAELFKSRYDGHDHFDLFKLIDNISIQMVDGGLLKCGQADIDFHVLEGRFLAKPSDFVIYSETYKNRNNQEIDLKLESQHMDICLSQDPKGYTIKQIQAREGVSLYYGNNFRALAEKAFFQRAEKRLFGNKFFHGTVTMEPQDPHGLCHVFHGDSDWIKAKKIHVDSIEDVLFCEGVEGKMYAYKICGFGEEMQFSSSSLNWDEKNAMLKLGGSIFLEQNGIGQVRNKQELALYWDRGLGGRDLREMSCMGETSLYYFDEKNDVCFTLCCCGGMNINHSVLKALFYSNIDNGFVPEDQQVFFQDGTGEVRGNTILVDYGIVKNKLQPVKVKVIGNVRVLNGCSESDEVKKKGLQYALADEAELFLLSREVRLISKEGRQVLFFDKEKNIEMSAQEIRAKRDLMTKGDSIRGIGVVRCSFEDKELLRLKKAFNIDEYYGM